MPFNITEYKFGEERGLMITNDTHNHHIDILPGYGALLARIEFFGQPIVEPINSYQVLLEDHWYRNFWLMPFQNRIRDGKYSIDDQTYQLTINDEKDGNALHGFFYELPLTDVNWKTEKESAIIEMEYIYDGNKSGYPFPFKCKIKYLIDSSGEIELSYMVSNNSYKNMPFSIGWHPYFQLDGDKSTWQLNLNQVNHLKQDKRNLPTGDEEIFNEEIDLVNVPYDHSFKFTSNKQQSELTSSKFKLELIQDENMSFVQLFSPPRNSVAIEPVSSGIDAFNTKDGLKIIKPGDSYDGKIVLKITRLE